MHITVILVIALLLLVGFVAALAAGVVRLEKTQEKPTESKEDSEEPESTKTEELVNLKDYYAEETAKKAEAAESPPEPPKEVQEDQYDMLCNVKVGHGYLLDCQNALSTAKENGQTCAVIYFDFNRFRFINTLKGFATGDYVLTRITQEAKGIISGQSLITRLGADHFVAMFAYIDNAQLEELFEQLKRAADRIRGDIGAKSGLQICMGVALTGESAGSYDIFTLIRKANIARYCLKTTKPDSFAIFDETMITSYLYGESALDDYNELKYSDDFALFLRPQLLLSSKRISGCDSRPGWSYEENPNYSNQDESLTSAGNRKTVYHLFRAMSRWRKSNMPTIPSMVTLSELDILKEDIDAFFARCLGEFQLTPNTVTVAVSLHTLRMAPEIVRAQMHKLRDLGMKLAICGIDRGMENNLDILKEQPVVNCLKFHRNFVNNLATQETLQEEVRKMMSIATGLGADTLFDGVDSASAVTWLSQAGAYMAQGRYVGRENPPDEFMIEVKNVLHSNAGVNSTVILNDNDLQHGNFNLF